MSQFLSLCTFVASIFCIHVCLSLQYRQRLQGAEIGGQDTVHLGREKCLYRGPYCPA